VKRILSIFTSFFLLFGLIVLSPASLPSAHAVTSVDGAFEDLGRCLQSQGKNKVLDVFYLVDESGSLQETDPDNARADILSSSLQQLASFKNDVTVNYSVGFFAHSYGVWQAWRTVNKGGIVSEAARLNAEVRKRNEGDLTDWLQGINGAIDELNAQHELTNGCSTLIWLTDGGIQLSTMKKTTDAVTQLCTNRFDVLRKNGVTVLGILLKNEQALARLTAKQQEVQAYYMSLMEPLVTGKGTLSDGTEVSCGSFPIPKNYRQGALFVAHDPKDLAFEFLKLPPRIEGCANINSLSSGNGNFEIENGISEFQIVTTASNWNLIDPSGKSVTAASSDIGLFQTAGASQIKIGTTNSGIGKWKFSGQGGESNLYLCSGLDIRINPGTEFISGKAGILSGKVVDQATGLAADLTKYDSEHPITIELISGGKSGAKKKAQQSDPANFMLQKFTPGSGSSEAEVRITLFLKTKNGIQLAPVSMSQKIDVRLLSNYPTLKTEPIVLSALASAAEPASGVVIFLGPKSADGKICVNSQEKPIVIQDNVERSDSYQISLKGVDANGCMPIRQGEESKLTLKVGNSVTANAHVILGVAVTYYSDAEPGKHFALNAEVNFDSGVPGNPLLWIIFLTILGILLPLGLIYLLLWWATRIAYGRQLQRAEYPIAINTDGRITARDGSAVTTQGDNYIGRPQQADVRVVQDGSTTMSAKLPKSVLAEPWYEIKAPEGSRIISVGNIAPRIKNKKRFKSAKLAPIIGDLGKIWYILVTDAALLKAEKSSAIEAKLVIFNRRDNTNLNQHRDSFSKVSSKPGLGTEVENLITIVKTEKPSTKSDGGSSGGNPSGGSSGPSGGNPSGGSRGPARPSGPGAPGAPTRTNIPGAPTRSGPPTSSPSSSGIGLPTSSGGPSRPSAPGSGGPPRRGGPGAPP
jgi:hypothetical protein